MNRLWAIAVFFPLAALSHFQHAEPAAPLPVEDALKSRQFCELTPVLLSPDGKWLAYTVSENSRAKTVDDQRRFRSGVPEWVNEAQIWILNFEKGTETNLTGGTANNWLPSWSPDSRYLAFLSDRDGSGQARIWVWDVKKNDLKRVSDIDIRAIQIEWTPDSKKILVTKLPDGFSPEDYVKTFSSSTGDSHNSTLIKVPGSTVSLYQARAISGQHEAPKSDPWNLNLALWDLAVIDADSGESKTIVHGQRIEWHLLSPDGSRIAYTKPKRFEKPGSQQVVYDLAVVDPYTMVERVVASDIRLNFAGNTFSWSPNSLKLSYRTFGMEDTAHDCYVVDANGGSPVNITKLVPRGPYKYYSGTPLWDSQGDSIYLIHAGVLWQALVAESKAVEVARLPNREVTALVPWSESILWTTDEGRATVVVGHDERGKQDGFYRIDLKTGKSTRLIEKGQCLTCTNLRQMFSVTKNGKSVLYFAEDAQHDTDAWMTGAGFENPRRATNLNPQFDKYPMGSARLIDWLSDDGDLGHGALLLPADYVEGKRYPLIVYVYGGASLSDKVNLFGVAGRGPFNMQLVATRGYAVLLPDAPQRVGTPMSDLAKTVLPGVNKVVEMGIADLERVAVMGHSYGGYSTLSLIVQSNRFKAAIDIDGYGDLISAYGQMRKDGSAFQTSITEQGQGLMGGTPWQFRERYIENSPVFYFDEVETPLLIVHGSEDTTVAPYLGDELFVTLRRLGKEVAYAKYQGEGHVPSAWSYANQVDFCNRVISWFDRFLNGSH